MAGSESGCHTGYIENGFVATTSCQVVNSRTYCRYYCHNGYEKTAATAYCAGNDKWIPTGSHPSQDTKPCRKSTDTVPACDDIFFKNGYVVTCPDSHRGSKKNCMYKCFQGYKPASSSVHCILNEWLTSDTHSEPCIPDGSTVKPESTSRRSSVRTTTSPRTTYPGYYDDPNLKMDVSPIVFVAAVIGGLLIIGLLVFAIFFRAHKKSTRDARERSLFIAASDPLSTQNDYTNNGADTAAGDSQYREVARRIITQSQNQSTYSPPLDPNSSGINNINPQNTFNFPSAPPYSAVQSHSNESNDMLGGQPSPPYSTGHNSEILEHSLHTANDQRSTCQPGNTRRYDLTTAHGISTPNENPPPYEEIQKDTENFTDSQTYDPPPPYTIDGSKQ